VKTAGRLMKHAQYYWLLLAEGHLTRQLFRGDSAADLGAAGTDWIGRGGRKEIGGRDGEESEKSLAMTPCGLYSYREEADLAVPPAIGVARDEKLPNADTSGGGRVHDRSVR
jgi:hypothetical protein